MDNYVPPFTVTNTMLQLTSSISEKVGKIGSHNSLESRPHLRRNYRIRSIHSSLKIEANSLSLTEVRDVIDGHYVFGDQKEIQEVKNAYSAYEMIDSVDPYSVADLKMLHGIMTADLIAESGKFRSGQEGVFSDGKCIFVAPPPSMVPGLMDNLFRWMKDNSESVHPLILSSVFHYEFVFIHPFSDGNGRMARLWHTVLLSKWKSLFEYIPLESQIETFQNEYYDAIATCHVNGNSNVFIEFILKQIDCILSKTVEQLEHADMETSEYVQKLLHTMEFDVSYTAAALLEKLGLKSKETLRKNYIDPALKQNYIVMTVPDKPKSRNQRYVRER